MTVQLLTPTTDSVWGWLILAIIALVVSSGGLALWEEIRAHIVARREWAAEIEADRRAAFVSVTITADTDSYVSAMRRAGESARRLRDDLDDGDAR